MLEFEELLVPVDFSPGSRVVLAVALELASGERPVVIVQHVVDPAIAAAIATQGYDDEETVLGRMRQHAERELEEIQRSSGDAVEVQVLLSEGTPFYEIVRVADELAVDAVVIGKSGIRSHPESAFFGSTAERVVRSCRQPVIILPGTD